MSDDGGGPEDGTSVVVVSGDEYSSSVQLQTMESHDLPTELTTADLENLANNPSLWLNLEGSLVGNTELSTLQATEIPSVDIDGLSSAPATITLENIVEPEMSHFVGVESLEEEIIDSEEQIETMEISSATEEPYVQDMECSMEVEIGAHEECEVQAPQIVFKPPTPVQQTVTIPSKKTTAAPTQYILNQATGQTILFTSKPSVSTPAPITLQATAGATQSFRLISPAKTLTLAQAQQMGLISPKKGQTLVVNKLAIPSVTKPAVPQGIKPAPVTVVKSGPAKIAPAPPTPGSTAVSLIGGVQQPIIITANPVSSSQLIMKSSSTPIRMVTAISPNKAVTKPQTGTTFATARAPGITPARPNTPTTHYIRIPASQALAAGLVPAGPQLQLASGAGKIQLVRLVGSAGVSPNKGPRTVLQSTQVRHIAPLPGTQTIVRMASPHQAGTVTKTVVPKGASVSTASRLLLSATSLMGGTNNGNVVMLPASVLSSSLVTQATAASGIMTTAASRLATATTPSSATQIKPKEPVIAKATSAQQSQLQQQSAAAAVSGQPAAPQIRAIVESNGLRPRKPCNCTKSQCLKLYCDCFANGEFCYQCNCVNCFNNLSHEEERQKSIKQCLDRNPNAFRPKIGKSSGDSRRHNKGCHCKRSGCLKNYCECYEAKISCTDACRCIGCKNIDECGDRKPLKEAMDLEPRLPTPASRTKIPVSNADTSASHDYLSTSAASATPGSTSASRGGLGVNTVPGSNVGARPAFSFVTQEVVEATCQCLLARAEEAQEAGKNVADTQLLVLEEFGRCLLQIIDYANKAKGNPS